MKQIKLTAAAIFAATIFLVSCGGGKKSAADLAKDYCKEVKEAGTDATKLKDLSDKFKKQTEEATKGMKEEEIKKYNDDFAAAILKCGEEEKK